MKNQDKMMSIKLKTKLFEIISIDKLKFMFNILSWYGFTVLSTIFSKKYLSVADDTHTLTLITFAYPALFQLLTTSLRKTLKILNAELILLLAIFNIGTILLTNIGMNETSVSLTYMVKVMIFSQHTLLG